VTRTKAPSQRKAYLDLGASDPASRKLGGKVFGVSWMSRSVLAWAAVALLGAWLLWPALAPVHVEGFSASIVSLGLHMAGGTVADFMPSAPFNADYFGLTKLGAVTAVAALSPVFGGDGAMRAIMFASLVVLLGASAGLIRRWTGARWLTIALVLILVPGVTENSFFFNDNLPAAALLALALLVLDRARSWQLALLAGLIIGWAVAVRTDVVLVALVATPLITFERQGLRRAAVSTAVAGLAAVAVLFAVFAMAHASPLDALRAGALATRLWDRPAQPLAPLVQFLYFCGWPGLALLVLGVFQLASRKAWRSLALLAGAPLVFSAVLFPSLWQSRQFLVLTPFLCAIAAQGGEAALVDFRQGRRLIPAAIAAIALLVLLGPVRDMAVSDGPRELIGRLRGIRLWTEWQSGVRQDMATIGEVISALPPGRPVTVLTDGWDDDRYLHLQLQEQGFRRTALPPLCAPLGEGMGRRDRTLVQVTLLQPFVPYWPALQSQRLEQGALPCISAVRPASVVLLGRKGRIDALLHPLPGQRPLGPDLGLTRTSPIVAVTLDATGLAALDQAYRREAAAMGQRRDWRREKAAVVSQTGFSRSPSSP
jgi:hypothetical protein